MDVLISSIVSMVLISKYNMKKVGTYSSQPFSVFVKSTFPKESIEKESIDDAELQEGWLIRNSGT